MNYINIKLLNILLKHNLNKQMKTCIATSCCLIKCFNIYEYYYTER